MTDFMDPLPFDPLDASPAVIEYVAEMVNLSPARVRLILAEEALRRAEERQAQLGRAQKPPRPKRRQTRPRPVPRFDPVDTEEL